MSFEPDFGVYGREYCPALREVYVARESASLEAVLGTWPEIVIEGGDEGRQRVLTWECVQTWLLCRGVQFINAVGREWREAGMMLIFCAEVGLGWF